MALDSQRIAVAVEFSDLIRGEERLRTLGRSETTVPLGHIAVANYEGGKVFDHDGAPEIYLVGETITKPFFRGRSCTVVFLAEHPGDINITVERRLAGLSLTDTDWAQARFGFHLLLLDPFKLLSHNRERTASGPVASAPKSLQERIGEWLEKEAAAVLTSDLQLWSHPDIDEVASAIFTVLNRQLAAWGLSIAREVLAVRQHPALLYTVVLQFRAAEQDLRDLPEAEKADLAADWGVSSSALDALARRSESLGRGAGLFSLAQEQRGNIDPIADWLDKRARAKEAANFLHALFADPPGFQATDIALSEQVVLGAFRHPILGPGEWGETER